MLDKPREWTPLVYCWRGGKRSGALATVLDQIGFRVHVLDGGYRDFRRAVVAELAELPARFDWRVVCGPTGSGKSRLLGALAAQGAQVLDLEALANHRGSVLGLVPGSGQPSQKEFDTRVWNALRGFDPARDVFVESESKKIGDLRVADALIAAMRAAPCLWLELGARGKGRAAARRVRLLRRRQRLRSAPASTRCATLRGNDVVARWQDAARSGRAAEVVRELLTQHYDPVYLQSMSRNFAGVAAPIATLRWDGSEASLQAAAASAIAVPSPVFP